jgi:hypothetical protein
VALDIRSFRTIKGMSRRVSLALSWNNPRHSMHSTGLPGNRVHRKNREGYTFNPNNFTRKTTTIFYVFNKSQRAYLWSHNGKMTQLGFQLV